MQIQRRQKGFTLVELLVVIAIIAILATVSIIGYTQFIKRANMSADQQAVTQMNTLLEGLDVTNEPDDVVDLWAYLNETGLDAEDYKPLSKDHYFFWDQSLNRILLVDKDNKVVFPEAYADAGMANGWYTLSGTIHLGDKPTIESGAVEIASASDFIQTMADNAAGVSSMKLKGDVNMLGASHGSVTLNTLNRTFTLDGNNKTLSNLVSTEYATVGTTDIFVNKKYSSGLFGYITEGQILTVRDIVFDGLVMGSYDIGSTGILAGIIRPGAKVTLENVTFKNCTIYGQNKVGLIAGGVYGELILNNVKVENCVVNASEGEAGMLFGTAYYQGKVTADANCSITNTVVNNVEYGLHEIVDVAGAKFVTRVRYASGAPKVEKAKIVADEYGIGYISLASYADSGLKGLKYEGVEPTEANVLDKSYKLTRNFNYVVRNDYAADSKEGKLVAAFVAYMFSKEGKEIIKSKDGILEVEATDKTWAELKAAHPVVDEDNSGVTLRLGGSTSVQKIAEALSAAFKQISGCKVAHNHTGSGAAYKATQGSEKDGATGLDIGFASREFKDSEPAAEGTFGKICVDAIVAVVNNKNSAVNAVTAEQLVKMYNGTFKKWADIADQFDKTKKITLCTRDTTSGTRDGFFTGIGLIAAASDNAPLAAGFVEVTGNGDMIAKIEGQEYTATTRCATPATIGWFKKSDNSYVAVSDLYCALPAIEVTTIAQMNANIRT